MKDRYDRDVNVNQEVVIYYGGEFYNATITSKEEKRVYFKIINPQVGEPKTGSFNRIETGRYLTILNKQL